MKISKIENANTSDLAHTLRLALYDSRFNAEVGHNYSAVTVSKVRLKTKKQWCGSHPAECEIGQDKPSTMLEGADWVEFNDTLNDVLDRLNVSARVESVACVIRKGAERRVHYEQDWERKRPGQNFEWLRVADDPHYEDHRGRTAPRSSFPEGTPGIYAAIGYAVEG